eukprot:11051008-Heterocapsa_arctica.AAC.1
MMGVGRERLLSVMISGREEAGFNMIAMMEQLSGTGPEIRLILEPRPRPRLKRRQRPSLRCD